MIWCLYYGGRLLVWPGAFFTIVVLTYLILGDMSGLFKLNDWSRSNRQANEGPAIER
jgi:hypothetical protein